MNIKHINTNRIFMAFFALVFSFTAISIVLPAKTNAVTASDWRAGRIIDDAIFFNKDAMSVAQIQNFLNAKVPVCDRNRQTYFNYAGKPYGPPFTCLKEYQENPTTKENNIGRFNADGAPYNVPGGQSAAQIIWNAAQAYGINPQSLIVNLQKETGLITDTWAAGWQYDRAMGYGCPDSGPGGTANCNANYYGFYNQVVDAAYQFRNYTNNPQYFNFRAGVTRNILWNVSGCGSAPVYIENAATAALYNYTPYQPNQAALNNMYGTGDGCSAYGNRNFWRMFNDWFGSTELQPLGVRPAWSTSSAKQKCSISALEPNRIGRMYNPDTRDYLFTSSTQEVCLAITYGYMWDGVVFKNAGDQPGITKPVYRLSTFGRHVYTSDINIKNQYVNDYGYSDEGILFYGYINNDINLKTTPVYHMGNNITTLLTYYDGERLINEAYLGLSTYGVSFYAIPEETTGETVDSYRLRSDQRGWLFTANPYENYIGLSYGFISEGSSFKIPPSSAAYTTPIYRLRSPSGIYFYTNSRPERDLAVINHDYINEGIAFFGKVNPGSQGKPVYRLTNYQNGKRLYTNSELEKNSAINNYGYTYEGVAWFDN